MDAAPVKPGDVVRVVGKWRAKLFHRSNSLPWYKNTHGKFIGKIGIVQSICNDKVTANVTFFYCVDRISSNGSKRLTSVTIAWHVMLLREVPDPYFVDGDRPVLCTVRANGEVEHQQTVLRCLSLRADGCEPVFSLKTRMKEMLTWKQSSHPLQRLVPVFVGRRRQYILRDRKVTVESTAMRVLNGVCLVDDGTEMMMAVRRFKEDNGRLLRIAVRTRPNIVNMPVGGKTPLFASIEEGVWPVFVVLMALGGGRDAVDESGNTLYHCAVNYGHLKVLQGLLYVMDRDVNRVNALGDTPLHNAIRQQNAAAVDRLMSCRLLQPNILNHRGETPLHLACMLPDTGPDGIDRTIVTRLLSHPRTNPFQVNLDRLTPLHITIQRDHGALIQILVHWRRALLTATPREGLPPLLVAASLGKHKALEAILKMKEDIPLEHQMCTNGRTALHYAVGRWSNDAENDLARLACIQTLVMQGSSINYCDSDGKSAVHLLMTELNIRMQDQLLDNRLMQTALLCCRSKLLLDDIAAKMRPHWQLAALCFLIARGADLSLRDGRGISPMESCECQWTRDLMKECSSKRARAIFPMVLASAEFDSSEMHMCTFNCDDSAADVIFETCGHRVICTSCAEFTPLRRCPTCFSLIRAAKDLNGNKIEMGSALKNPNRPQSPVMPELDVQRIAEEAAMKVKRDMEKEKKNELEELRNKLEQLEMETSCGICLDARPSVVFNCGHTTCRNCADQLKICHICRNEIQGKQTMYA